MRRAAATAVRGRCPVQSANADACVLRTDIGLLFRRGSVMFSCERGCNE